MATNISRDRQEDVLIFYIFFETEKKHGKLCNPFVEILDLTSKELKLSRRTVRYIVQKEG